MDFIQGEPAAVSGKAAGQNEKDAFRQLREGTFGRAERPKRREQEAW